LRSSSRPHFFFSPPDRGPRGGPDAATCLLQHTLGCFFFASRFHLFYPLSSRYFLPSDPLKRFEFSSILALPLPYRCVTSTPPFYLSPKGEIPPLRPPKLFFLAWPSVSRLPSVVEDHLCRREFSLFRSHFSPLFFGRAVSILGFFISVTCVSDRCELGFISQLSAGR